MKMGWQPLSLETQGLFQPANLAADLCQIANCLGVMRAELMLISSYRRI